MKPAILAVAFAATFGVGIGVGKVDLSAAGAAAASPAPSFQPGNELALVDEAWAKIHDNYVAGRPCRAATSASAPRSTPRPRACR